MLRVGLTGGIGSGKSTVAQRLSQLGATVIDADLLAREVVAPGSRGLAAIVDRFGDAVLDDDGALNRPALGALVFSDEGSRRDLEAITHPLIADRTRELVAAAPPGAVVVHDVPLLVEKHYGPRYHLVVVVGSEEQTRVKRLMRTRGMTEDDARSLLQHPRIPQVGQHRVDPMRVLIDIFDEQNFAFGIQSVGRREAVGEQAHASAGQNALSLAALDRLAPCGSLRNRVFAP